MSRSSARAHPVTRWPRRRTLWDLVSFSSAGGLAWTLGSLGCGTSAIPTVAVEGTTITIPIPKGYPAGFGLALSRAMTSGSLVTALPQPNFSATSPWEDVQRGEVVFRLERGGNLRTYLPVRLITRGHIDEATTAAESTSASSGWGVGQVLAFVDIPADVGPTPTDASGNVIVPDGIVVQRFRRPLVPDGTGQLVPFVEDPPMIGSSQWRGWAKIPWNTSGPENPLDPIPITIVARPGNAPGLTPLRGWDHGFGALDEAAFDDDLELLLPNPKVRVWLSNPLAPSPPAAVEIQIQYPREYVDLRGAEVNRGSKSDGLVIFEPDPNTNPLPSDCGASELGTFRVKVIDPTSRTNEVYVPYRVRNFDKICRKRLAPADFTITAVVGYDQNGVQIPGYGVSYPAVADASF